MPRLLGLALFIKNSSKNKGRKKSRRALRHWVSSPWILHCTLISREMRKCSITEQDYKMYWKFSNRYSSWRLWKRWILQSHIRGIGLCQDFTRYYFPWLFLWQIYDSTCLHGKGWAPYRVRSLFLPFQHKERHYAVFGGLICEKGVQK